MGLFVKRYDTGETVQVKKYIIDLHENEESIWSNDWYGRHVIGRHCEWCDGEKSSHDALVGGLSKHAVMQQSELFTCKFEGGKDKCRYKAKDYFTCVMLRRCEFASE